MPDPTRLESPAPSDLVADARARQAREEAGVTEVSGPAAIVATLLFLATVALVPVVDLATGDGPAEAAAALAGGGRAALGAPGPLASNRELQAAIDRAESALEDGSVLERELQPWAQLALTRVLGAGTERAYPGDPGWLFYRPDVDHLIGRGFLEPRVLERRRRSGDAWRAPPHPDPLPALTRFAARLERAGARLVVVPIPVKPMVQPGRLSDRYPEAGVSGTDGGPTDPVLRNPSWPGFVERLEAAGIEWIDLAPAIAAAPPGEDPYLATDTHWRPETVDRAAAALARSLADRGLLPAGGGGVAHFRRAVTIEGVGDIVPMLGLPADQGLYPPERVRLETVLDAGGRPWRADRDAEILLLGDSFTNIYSDSALGWGTGAGFAEQLAFHAGVAVDRIAQNAGGAWASRRALERGGAERLAGKRLVLYQFAARELSSGDWRPEAEDAPPGEPVAPGPEEGSR